jgi:hypothetical protein
MISSALNIGASGLRTMQAVIDNHSRNIANADTPGYRRRDTLLAEQVNGGVTYSTAHRFNETTAARLTQLAGEVGASDALARELTGAQAQLGTASTQLADAQHSLATALANAVFAPNDATTRTMVAENAAGLAQIADTNLRELDARITGANQAERLTRAQAQTKLDELAMLNQQVLANGATPAIRDRQAQVGQELASLAGGEMRFNPNGSAEFRIDGMLVLTSAGAKQLPQTLGGQAGGFAQARAELTGLRDGFETNLREYARAMNTLNQQGVDAGGQPGEELFSMEGGRFSFVGSAFGNRRELVQQLAGRGVAVECFGYGWPNGPVDTARMRSILRESVVSLNFGDSGLLIQGGRLARNRQIKARNFEVPGCGGFLLTETLESLENFYTPGREVVIYEGIDDLAGKIRYYLDHPAERDAIALAGHRRTASAHTYDARFRELLGIAARHKAGRPSHAPRIDFARFSVYVRRHRSNAWLAPLKWALLAPCVLIWGRQRGPRAARRILFELSWRVAGARTYTCTGLPGRLFYKES